MEKVVSLEKEISIINCTPHSIKFQTECGIVEVPPSGWTLAASVSELVVAGSETEGLVFVKPSFIVSDEGLKELEEIEHLVLGHSPKPLIIGSLISAQTYKDVYGIVPLEGHERKPPNERLYSSNKFSILSFK